MPLQGEGFYAGADTVGGGGAYDNPLGSHGAHWDLALPELGWVALMPATGSGVKCLLGEGTPNITEGYSRWGQTDRPGDLPINEYVGQNLDRWPLALLFDGMKQNRSVEGQIRKLEAMARPARGGEPPTLKVFIAGNKPRSWRRNWVIESLEWGDAERKPGGQRIRQWVVANLLQRGDDDLISPARRRNQDRSTVHIGTPDTGSPPSEDQLNTR